MDGWMDGCVGTVGVVDGGLCKGRQGKAREGKGREERA